MLQQQQQFLRTLAMFRLCRLDSCTNACLIRACGRGRGYVFDFCLPCLALRCSRVVVVSVGLSIDGCSSLGFVIPLFPPFFSIFFFNVPVLVSVFFVCTAVVLYMYYYGVYGIGARVPFI